MHPGAGARGLRLLSESIRFPRAFRWSALRCDHRLLSATPSVSLRPCRTADKDEPPVPLDESRIRHIRRGRLDDDTIGRHLHFHFPALPEMSVSQQFGRQKQTSGSVESERRIHGREVGSVMAASQASVVEQLHAA